MMKTPHMVLTMALTAFSTAALAQTHVHDAATTPLSAAKVEAAQTAAAKTPTQQSFDALKSLAGSWEGAVHVVPPVPAFEGQKSEITLRVTSRGNALVHEIHQVGVPDDPARYDHPLTMLYMDGDRLLLTHYCDAGNRPRMEGTVSRDGKMVEFDFLDVSGSVKYGHMHHAVFTMVDADHHMEDWTYMMPGDKPMHAHFDLQRKN
jgi:hypothetical protein